MKYQLICKKCGKVIGDFATWFKQDQKCECGSTHAEVTYSTNYKLLDTLCSKNQQVDNLYHYFDFLPIEHKENIISLSEGAVPIEEWKFLSDYAKQNYNIECKVYICRNDLNGGTGTFKDIAASLAATVFKENKVKEYCLASTGNAGAAYSTYLSHSDTTFNLFAPSDMYQETVDKVKETGQNLHISDGNYGDAKREAAEFHAKHNVMISAGNIDPIRIEAKKTLVFECLRQLGAMPTVYMQAVAGGTSPIAFEKGMREIATAYPQHKMPRMILVQQDRCDPMVQAWEWATENGFPDGYEQHYPSITTDTRISILSAGTPGMYPLVGPIVKSSGGRFVRISEAELAKYGKIVKDNMGIYLGPASVVCIAGFYQALKEGAIKNSDTILLNTGEGCERASWFREEIDKL